MATKKTKYTKGESRWDGSDMDGNLDGAQVTGKARTCRDWKCRSGPDGLAPALLPLLFRLGSTLRATFR